MKFHAYIYCGFKCGQKKFTIISVCYNLRPCGMKLVILIFRRVQDSGLTDKPIKKLFHAVRHVKAINLTTKVKYDL
jgi:hypothetical protein